MTRGLVEFHSNGDAFARRLEEKRKEVEAAGKRGLKIIGEDWVKRQKKVFGTFTNSGTPQARIQSRRGKLRSSARAAVFGSQLKNMGVRLKIGSKLAPYAGAQEWGSNPKAKANGWMRIPLPMALTPSGKIKSKARTSITGTTKKGRPIYTSGFGRMVAIRTNNGNLVIVAKKKGRKKGSQVYATKEPLYVLKKEVKVPPRLNARKTLGGVLKKRMPRLRGAIFQILAPASMLKGGR